MENIGQRGTLPTGYRRVAQSIGERLCETAIDVNSETDYRLHSGPKLPLERSITTDVPARTCVVFGD